MKYVFTDVDGVLNCRPYQETHAGQPDRYLNPENVRRLALLVHGSGALLILASTWGGLRDSPHKEGRELWGMLGNTLRMHGLELHDVAGDGPRHTAVAGYLGTHPADGGYIILDDDYTPEDYQDAGLDPRRVITTRYWCRDEKRGGLLDSHVKRALEILGPGNGPTP